MDWSPRRALEWFVSPGNAFADGASRRAAVVVVLVLCVLNAALVSQAAGAVADATVGTTQVENPQRPADWICEQAGSDEVYEDYQEACQTEPETVTRTYASAARDAANGLVLVALLAPAVACLAIAGVFAVALGGRSHDDPDDRVSYATALAVTGIGLAPAALRYAARTFVVDRSLADRSLSPTSLDDARRLALDAMTPETALYLAVVVATVALSASVWRAGLRAAFDRDTRIVDAAVAFAAVALVLQAVVPVYVGGEAALYGAGFVLLGLPALAAPRVLERIDLFFDLLGTRGSVELKPWRVLLEQVGGLALVLIGAALLGAFAFA
ncbi:MAG: hypothetical protein ABEH83_01635 [Halobacterium sp.]